MGKLSRIILAMMLIISPALLGSNRAIFWALNGGLAGTAVLFFMISELRTVQHDNVNSKFLLYVVGLFALPVIWIALQLLPGVPPFLAHPVWQSIPDASARITINPHQTVLALLWWLSLAIVFVAIPAGTVPSRSRWFLHLMMYTILGVAIFGFSNMYLGWNSVGIIAKTAYLNWLTGTFVNRNTAASFFVIGLSLASIFCIEAYNRVHKTSDHLTFIAGTLNVLDSSVPLYFGIGLVIFVATLLTGSRAGIATAAVALVVTYLLSNRRKKKTGSYFGLFAGFSFLIFLGIAFNALYERSNDAVDSSWARVELAKEAWAAVKASPFFGHGAGTYQSVEPLFHSTETSSQQIWNHAHNSYLEAAADLGIPLTMCWIILSVILMIKLYVVVRSSTELKPATVALLSVSCAESLHALVDFSLQTQAVAIYISCLIGLAIGEANSKKSTASSHYPRTAL